VEDRSARATRILEDAGAIITGDHFVYITGDHGDGWIDKDAIFPHTQVASDLCRMLAEAVGNREIDYVCGPATGGLIVSQWTAHHLGVASLFSEHDKGRVYQAASGALHAPFVLGRGYGELVRGARVLVVDDVVNTGQSIRETAEIVAADGGTVVALAALCSRGNATPDDLDGHEFVYLTEIKIPSWQASECRLCSAGVPINTHHAHGGDYLAATGLG
jgi:orotate phosphoribosyltransferase